MTLTHFDFNSGKISTHPDSPIPAKVIETFLPLIVDGTHSTTIHPAWNVYTSIGNSGFAMFTIYHALDFQYHSHNILTWRENPSAMLWQGLERHYLEMTDKPIDLPIPQEFAAPADIPGPIPWLGTATSLAASVDKNPFETAWIPDFVRTLSWIILRSEAQAGRIPLV